VRLLSPVVTGVHYELFARWVMPVFQRSQQRLLGAEAHARSRHAELDEKNGAAIQAWTDRYAAERARASGNGAVQA
jgi:limonene 1,2-monooxygenase